MLFHAHMDVHLPLDLAPALAGEYANHSVLDIDSHQELHALLTGLPLYPDRKIAVTPLCCHPSSIRDDYR